ncbi:MAG: heparan-alpha-glucosaminide N-acetyltransferase domain-containing protein, partial [Acidobacteriaceae bacterium]
MSTLPKTERSAVPGGVSLLTRLESVDIVRGIIMVLMALDHVRDFFGIPGISPTDVTRATAALFLTRWITNLCAPGFFLLMGTGAYLSLRKRSRSELAAFLITRGLWLIFVEVVLMRCFGLQFNFDYHVTLLTVLWALGWAMIGLAVLLALPTRWIAAVGIVMSAAHNLLD